MRNISRLFAFILALSAVTMASASMGAQAATLVGPASFPTGVDGLVVDGTTYNVTFTQGSYDTIYATTPPTFLGNLSGGSDAGAALASALNMLDPSAAIDLAEFDVVVPDAENTGLDAGFQVVNFNGTFGSFPVETLTSSPTVSNQGQQELNGYAVFQVAPVPEPSTWAMLLIGFAGIGFATRRCRVRVSTFHAT